MVRWRKPYEEWEGPEPDLRVGDVVEGLTEEMLAKVLAGKRPMGFPGYCMTLALADRWKPRERDMRYLELWAKPERGVDVETLKFKLAYVALCAALDQIRQHNRNTFRHNFVPYACIPVLDFNPGHLMQHILGRAGAILYLNLNLVWRALNGENVPLG